MPWSFQGDSYTLTPLALTGDRFTDFAPYVPSINNHGVVAFEAALKSGGTGIYTEAHRTITTIAQTPSPSLLNIRSHPDINDEGRCCFYSVRHTGGCALIIMHGGDTWSFADAAGPLGPTINDHGTVAYRADLPGGASAILTASATSPAPTLIARTGERFSAFHGLPVINNHGLIAFRAELATGAQGIYTADTQNIRTIVETGPQFRALGSFPIINSAGTLAFTATLHTGDSGIFIASSNPTSPTITQALDARGPFESFRGALLTATGSLIFYASPRGGTLGIFSGPDPHRHHILSIGSHLLGSTITDFALNPVSINDHAQLAIRAALADGGQVILRATPSRSPPE